MGNKQRKMYWRSSRDFDQKDCQKLVNLHKAVCLKKKKLSGKNLDSDVYNHFLICDLQSALLENTDSKLQTSHCKITVEIRAQAMI